MAWTELHCQGHKTVDNSDRIRVNVSELDCRHCYRRVDFAENLHGSTGMFVRLFHVMASYRSGRVGLVLVYASVSSS